ncbi:hypothetical protein J4460_05505 [Candidatus Woesearchaeota archaeon]|nr:MAG: hypothetical protein QS99_C0015G0014 [archaeon GW2011_AR4]MBS3130102.1 hypothetical protein [Candidatus Woesearchaeota archaeon]HIH38719.1 hypothetical protein [Candidatus Woesearchaeota archaeon]HIH49299.1 hypothetical protein [Candidatus Woesearchaeota archaeon]HIJ03639.1 hypothetical protein [Candidatus Woesearchaeota archaeon]
MRGIPNKFFLLLLAVMVFFLSVVHAQTTASSPEGPSSVTEWNETRRVATTAPAIQAFAGNVSRLDLRGNSVTQTWQGFFGNISGTITLDDGWNHTLYDWNLASPQGEVYATTLSTVTWLNVTAYLFNKSGTVGDIPYVDRTEYETSLGLAVADIDGVDETFKNTTTHTLFYVGSNKINGTLAQASAINDGAAPAIRLYGNATASVSGLFEEVLLYDYDNEGVIYTSLLEQDQTGFNNQTLDFEMIVGEDGHNGDVSTTTYYLYVELQ